MTKYLVLLPDITPFHVKADEVKIKAKKSYCFYVDGKLVCACPLNAVIKRDED